MKVKRARNENGPVNDIHLLVVEDDEFSMENILMTLEPRNFDIDTARSVHQAAKLLEENQYNILVTDVKLPGGDGISLVERFKDRLPAMKVIVITGYADDDAVIRALKLGVNEFLKKPYREKEMLISVDKLLEQQRLEEENKSLRERLEKENNLLRKESARTTITENLGIIGKSADLHKCMSLAEKVAKFEINALIQGESGTGKELFAQFIHKHGPRAKKPFVAVNCASISPSLFESELFGYQKGAFTGANESRAGLFEVANHGIIFLDEIGEVPVAMQAKLLRATETQSIRRVGSTVDIPIDVQIISATNINIMKSITENSFRLDLYHRLATIEIKLPPLRDRIEDFDMLFEHFMQVYEKQFDISAPRLSSTQIDFLKRQQWFGNVRQLSNFVKKWCLLGNEANDDDLSLWVSSTSEPVNTDPVKSFLRFDFFEGTICELENAKKMLVMKVLGKYKNNKLRTAKHLGLSYPGLMKMLKKFGEEGEDQENTD